MPYALDLLIDVLRKVGCLRNNISRPASKQSKESTCHLPKKKKNHVDCPISLTTYPR